MVQPRAGAGTVQIALRLSPTLRDRIKVAADQAGRSVNSELVATLEEKYPEPKPSYSVAEMVEYIQYLKEQAGDDQNKIAEVDAFEKGVIQTLLDALGVSLEDLGYEGFKADRRLEGPDAPTKDKAADVIDQE